MTRSNVLVLGLNYAPEHTGIAPYTAGMARGLSRDHDVQVVTAHPHYPGWQISDGYGAWRQDERDADVAVRRLRHYVPANPTGPTRVLSEVSFAARALASGVRRPDVVITVSPALLTVLSARVLAKRWGVSLGVVVHDLYSRAMEEVGLLGDRSSGPATRLESFALRGADGLVAIHDSFAQTMVDGLGVDRDRITVIPNWTHVPPPARDRDETRRRLGWGGETVVLHAGNMGAKQGLEHVVDTAALADRSDDRLRFVLMGNGNQRSDLERRAQSISGIDIIDGVPNSVPAGTSPLTTVLGSTRAERRIWLPASTTHREVIQTPSSMTTGRVSKAMSLRKACVPVVRKVPWLTTTSLPIPMKSWLWIQTPSPTQDLAPTESFHGNFTRSLGRRMTPSPIVAPKRDSTRALMLELTWNGLVTRISSHKAHK